jgi:CRP-like cAMP-binding protein
VIRHSAKSRQVARRRSASRAHVPGDQGGASGDAAPENRLLLQLPIATRQTLLNGADYITLTIGQPLARVGDAISAAYFPDSGLLALISEMTTGHHVAVAAVGAEGMIGLGVLFGLRHHLYSPMTFVPSRGYLVRADRLRRVFTDSEDLRRVVLAYVGGRIGELAIAAACNRVHSHRQRLARWLLIATDKAQQRSLPITHDALAQMVGGPRHAVTVALKQLRAKGAIVHRRGHIDVLRRFVLIEEACECYTSATPTSCPD